MTAVNASPAMVTSTIPATTIIGIAVGKRERESYGERYLSLVAVAFAVCLYVLSTVTLCGVLPKEYLFAIRSLYV